MRRAGFRIFKLMFSKNNSLLPRGTWWITARNTVSKRLKSVTKTTSSSKTLEILFPCLTFEKNIRFVHKFPSRRSHWQQHSHIWRDYPLFHHTTESTEKKPFCLSLSFDPSLRLLWMTIIFFWQKKKLWRRSRDIFFIFTTLEKYFSGNTGFFAKKYHFCQNNNLQNIFFLSLSSDKWRFFLLWFNSTKIGKKCLPVDNGDEPD